MPSRASASGSNGFNGYREDTTAGQWSRPSTSRPTPTCELVRSGRRRLVDDRGRGALRYEDFEDFGHHDLNGKVDGALPGWDGRVIAASAAVSSTGFRAPTPGQQNAFNVTTAFIDGAVDQQRGRPVHLHGSRWRGVGEQLQPEKSRELQRGRRGRDGGRSPLTADFFRIDIDDRLALAQENRADGKTRSRRCWPGRASPRRGTSRCSGSSSTTSRPRTQGIDLISDPGRRGRRSTTSAAVFNYTRHRRSRTCETSVIDDFRIYTLEQRPAEEPAGT